MMKMSLTMALAALLAVGCQKDSTHTPEEGQLTTVTATINNGDLGRVVFDDDGSSVLKVDWKDSGEAFWVEGNGYERFYQVAGTSTFTGVLDGGHPYYGNTYRAVYPITYLNDEEEVEMDYTQQSGVLDEKFNLMRSETRTDGTHFEFVQMTAIIKPTFKVAGENVNNQISEITLLEVKGAKWDDQDIKENITITCNQLKTIYIYLPRGAAWFTNRTILAAGESIALTATIGGEEYTGRITVPADHKIEMGKVYPLGITLTKSAPAATIGEAVDLGLSVAWATYNVGATAPEEYGDYFNWGEVEPRPGNKNCVTMYQYPDSLKAAGIIDADCNLTTNYDAAATNWGGDWRMPTADEMYELVTECTWELSTLNSVAGIKVTSKINSNSIFLPTAGRYSQSGSSLQSVGEYGNYWSGTMFGINQGTILYYQQSDANHYTHHVYNNYGLPIRPVKPKPIRE